MGSINTALGANIQKIRQQQGLQQQELADRIVALSGENVTRVMVSKWERGLTTLPAEMAHYISLALGVSSYHLWPHSDLVTDKDVELIQWIRNLKEDEKDDLLYLLKQWRGDTRALLKMDVIHAILPEWRRAEADRTIIEEYKEAIRTGDPDIDTRAKTDLPYVLKIFRELEK